MERSFRILILVGAARSGTKLLRGLVASHPCVDAVPYDVNYIWRLGNERLPHDELTLDLLTDQIQHRIVRALGSYCSHAPVLVEKTVSNCLRIPYVQAVLPEARFIHLLRDGCDVIESAYREWLAPADWRYIVSKARTFPLRSAFGYGLSYALGTVRRVLSHNRSRAAIWGPRYDGIAEDLSTMDVLEVCAVQWARSVEKALNDLGGLPADRVLTVRYEELVRDPWLHLQQIFSFAEVPPVRRGSLDLAGITVANIGKGARNLTADQRAVIDPHIRRVLGLLSAL